MASREERERGRETNPSRFPETTPPAQAADYAVHTIQTVLEMQRTLGGVETAIKHLEDRSKEHGDKLDTIGKDVHAAKVAVGVATAIIVGIVAIMGWIVTTYISAHPGH
jgi:gamma-glutamyl phosphate reductase